MQFLQIIILPHSQVGKILRYQLSKKNQINAWFARGSIKYYYVLARSNVNKISYKISFLIFENREKV